MTNINDLRYDILAIIYKKLYICDKKIFLTITKQIKKWFKRKYISDMENMLEHYRNALNFNELYMCETCTRTYDIYTKCETCSITCSICNAFEDEVDLNKYECHNELICEDCYSKIKN